MLISESDLRGHETGDIILSKSENKFGKYNINYQKFITKMESNYTHVYLCVDKGVFVEATINKNIEIFSYKDDRSSINCNEWTVYRNDLFYKNEELKTRLKESIFFHLGKSYDTGSLLLSLHHKFHQMKNLSKMLRNTQKPFVQILLRWYLIILTMH